MIDAFHLLDTGFCRALEASVVRGGAWHMVECHALAALLHHEREGWLLFDVGYAPRLTEATHGFPYRLYRWLLPAHTAPAQTVAAQLSRFGLTPGDMGHVLVSHFHPDHVGGLCDFPDSRLVCDGIAWEETRSVTGMDALRRGILPDLLPSDFAARSRLLGEASGPALPGVGPTHDLFGDGTLLLVPLPGHARGQLGLFLPDTPHGTLFLVADAVYYARAIRENSPFPFVTARVADDGRASRETILRLHQLHGERPDIILLPTHCPESLERVATWGRQ